MNTNFLSRIPERYWALLLMLVWGGAVLALRLIRFDTYGVDEGGARALLLNWSIADQIAHPIVVFGMPDFRALIFAPLGIYWPGSVVAAKVFSLLATFGAVWLWFRWSRQTQSEENALIGSGLLLIAPITLLQADAIGGGPYLLLMFGLAGLLDKKYRALDNAMSGWYFAQMLAIAITITLHPAGLAYPLALAWHWHQNPIQPKRRNQMWIGIGITAGVMLAIGGGWIALPWFSAPLPALGTAIFGLDPLNVIPRSWESGLVPALLLGVLVVLDRRFIVTDLLGGMLALGIALGAFAPDAGWSMLAVAFLLYRGTAWIITANQSLRANNFLGQRGLVFGTLVILATLFMQVDKAHRTHIAIGLLSPQDELIRTLSAEAEKTGENFRVASQWPGRTMLAVRHAALPLPPAAQDAETFLQMTKGVTHLMFAHNDPRNAGLARTIGDLGGQVETLALQAGGVIIRFRTPNPPAAGIPATP